MMMSVIISVCVRHNAFSITGRFDLSINCDLAIVDLSGGNHPIQLVARGILVSNFWGALQGVKLTNVYKITHDEFQIMARYR